VTTAAPRTTGGACAAPPGAAPLTSVGVDPRAAAVAAGEALAVARRTRDPGAASTALRAAGLARKELGDLDGALTALRSAVRTAQRAGLGQAAAEARMSLALVLLERGQGASALAQADRAAGVLRGPARARVLAQRALIKQRCGRLDEALEDYRRALPVLHRAGDLLWEARLRNNRGLLQAYRGSLRQGEADLRRAVEMFDRLGHRLEAADARWNLGFVAARRGDIPAALEQYDVTEAAYAADGLAAPELLVDRAEVLLTAGLLDEAQSAADAAVEQLTVASRESDLAEALLLQAQCSLAGGLPAKALEAATDAARRFRAQQRTGWQLVASHLALRARQAAADEDADLYRAADDAATALESHGWTPLAMDARIIAAQAAMQLGRGTEAARQLRASAGARRTGPVEVRLRAWHAEALLRVADGRSVPAVESALHAGLRALDEHRDRLGATELRVHAAAHGVQLADLGLRLALRDDDAVRALRWTEQWRASALRLRPVRPPADSRLAELLEELRTVSAQFEQALLEDRPSARLRARATALEKEIRGRNRRLQGDSAAERQPVAGPDQLLDQLKDRAMVSFLAVDGHVHALLLVDGEVTLHALTPVDKPSALLETLQFSLRRLASASGSPRALATARTSATELASRLDKLLFGPLRPRLVGRRLVVVPTAALHGVPWGLMPTTSNEPTVIAPSATVWCAADTAPESGTRGSGLLVAGPRLLGAAREVADLAAAYPDARCLSGSDATVAEVGAALEHSAWAHVAAHGVLRSDNPLFSSLELADGSLTIYDLERLELVPSLMALPACQSGLGSAAAGEEVLGLATALLALKARTVVATVIPVPDSSSRTLMVAFHDRLRAGDSAAAALHRARVALDPEDPVGFAGAAGFACLGTG
jgi:Tfp pilus assembly protein PilF